MPSDTGGNQHRQHRPASRHSKMVSGAATGRATRDWMRHPSAVCTTSSSYTPAPAFPLARTVTHFDAILVTVSDSSVTINEVLSWARGWRITVEYRRMIASRPVVVG